MEKESRRKDIMLCYPFEEKRLHKWNCPVIVQPKLDGERCRALTFNYTQKGNASLLLSSECNIFRTVPHINQGLQSLTLPNDLELDGELYSHNMSFEEIHSTVSSQRVSVSPDSEKIQLHIFDLVNDQPQWKRTKELFELKKIFSSIPYSIQIVPTYYVENFESLMEKYREFIALGYEGIIVRHPDNLYVRKRSTHLMKFKPKKSDIYEIIGYKEEYDKFGEPKGRLGALVCIGSDGTQFSVGSGLTEDDRIKFWKDPDQLLDKLCHIEYQHLTPGKKIPRFPVFVSVLDQSKQQFSL